MTAKAVAKAIATARCSIGSIATLGKSAAALRVDQWEGEEGGENGQDHHDVELHVESLSGVEYARRLI